MVAIDKVEYAYLFWYKLDVKLIDSDYISMVGVSNQLDKFDCKMGYIYYVTVCDGDVSMEKMAVVTLAVPV